MICPTSEGRQIWHSSFWWCSTRTGTRILPRSCQGTAPMRFCAVTLEVSTMPASSPGAAAPASAAVEMVPMLVPTTQTGSPVSFFR